MIVRGSIEGGPSAGKFAEGDVITAVMFYVIADATAFGLKLTPEEGREITRIGEMIKAAAREQLPVVPTISGRAWITGFSSYVLADDDPFPEGFTIGDIW